MPTTSPDPARHYTTTVASTYQPLIVDEPGELPTGVEMESHRTTCRIITDFTSWCDCRAAAVITAEPPDGAQ